MFVLNVWETFITQADLQQYTYDIQMHDYLRYESSL